MTHFDTLCGAFTLKLWPPHLETTRLIIMRSQPNCFEVVVVVVVVVLVLVVLIFVVVVIVDDFVFVVVVFLYVDVVV